MSPVLSPVLSSCDLCARCLVRHKQMCCGASALTCAVCHETFANRRLKRDHEPWCPGKPINEKLSFIRTNVAATIEHICDSPEKLQLSYIDSGLLLKYLVSVGNFTGPACNRTIVSCNQRSGTMITLERGRPLTIELTEGLQTVHRNAVQVMSDPRIKALVEEGAAVLGVPVRKVPLEPLGRAQKKVIVMMIENGGRYAVPHEYPERQSIGNVSMESAVDRTCELIASLPMSIPLPVKGTNLQDLTALASMISFVRPDLTEVGGHRFIGYGESGWKVAPTEWSISIALCEVYNSMFARVRTTYLHHDVDGEHCTDEHQRAIWEWQYVQSVERRSLLALAQESAERDF